MQPDPRPKRVLLDACMPHDLRHELGEFEVQTARHARLENLDDGPLLNAMAASFDVLITADKNLPLQHNIAARPIAVIVVRTLHNLISELLPLVPEIKAALAGIGHGEVRVIKSSDA